MPFSSKHSTMAEEQGAQQACNSILSVDMGGVSCVIRFVFYGTKIVQAEVKAKSKTKFSAFALTKDCASRIQNRACSGYGEVPPVFNAINSQPIF